MAYIYLPFTTRAFQPFHLFALQATNCMQELKEKAIPITDAKLWSQLALHTEQSNHIVRFRAAKTNLFKQA